MLHTLTWERRVYSDTVSAVSSLSLCLSLFCLRSVLASHSVLVPSELISCNLQSQSPVTILSVAADCENQMIPTLNFYFRFKLNKVSSFFLLAFDLITEVFLQNWRIITKQVNRYSICESISESTTLKSRVCYTWGLPAWQHEPHHVFSYQSNCCSTADIAASSPDLLPEKQNTLLFSNNLNFLLI